MIASTLNIWQHLESLSVMAVTMCKTPFSISSQAYLCTHVGHRKNLKHCEIKGPACNMRTNE